MCPCFTKGKSSLAFLMEKTCYVRETLLWWNLPWKLNSFNFLKISVETLDSICVFVYLLLFSHLVVSDSFCDPIDCSRQAPLSMGFPRKEYWSGLLFPSPGDLPDLGIKPMSPAWQADSLPLSQQESLHMCKYVYLYMFMCMHLCVCILYVCLCMCLFAESNDYP